jgi:ABC-type Na+ efflux pump permease subunit
MEEWSSIISVVFAFVMIILWALVFLGKKKGEGTKKVEEIYRHLREVGVEASLAEKGDGREKIGLSRASGQKSEGLIELEDRNIDSINVVSVSTQYGTRYFIDYLVKASNIIEKRVLKKTKLTKKKSPPLWGKVVAIDWKGDDSLVQGLNLDYSLEDKLLRADVNVFKGNIWIFPEPKHGYARIRTGYLLPSAAMFEAISSIARHIKSW